LRRESVMEKKLLNIIKDWAVKNKKIFWKYEVSSFYKSYVIKVGNLPDPSPENVTVSANNRLLNNQQKTDLSDAIKKAYTKEETSKSSSIDVKIDYEDGAVIAEVV
jgi:hypothetical protein